MCFCCTGRYEVKEPATETKLQQFRWFGKTKASYGVIESLIVAQATIYIHFFGSKTNNYAPKH